MKKKISVPLKAERSFTESDIYIYISLYISLSIYISVSVNDLSAFKGTLILYIYIFGTRDTHRRDYRVLVFKDGFRSFILF